MYTNYAPQQPALNHAHDMFLCLGCHRHLQAIRDCMGLIFTQALKSIMMEKIPRGALVAPGKGSATTKSYKKCRSLNRSVSDGPPLVQM